MPAVDADLLTFNAGEVSTLGLARIDLSKLRCAARTQSNFLPLILGPAIFRPGTASIAEVPGDAPAALLEFYFDEVTKAPIVVTEAGAQFLVDDAYIARGSVATAIENGDFAADLTGWTDSDQAGATSSWAAPGYLKLVGTGANYAQRDQEIAVAGGDVGKEHGIRLVVRHGNVRVMIGTAQGDNSYFDQTLLPGAYSLAVTPTGDFWVRLAGNDAFGDSVTSIAIEGPGAVSIPTPWSAADLGLIRYDQEGDVLFVACGSTTGTIGYAQMRIERRSADSRSWGVASYLADDGPFLLANQGATTITPSATNGVTTLTASDPLFQAGHVGALFQITQSGQEAQAALAGDGQATPAIRVSGLSNKNKGDPATSGRVFTIDLAGTFDATVHLQMSLGAPGNWTDVSGVSGGPWTDPVTVSFDDGLDNQIVYYQLIIKPGDYTSGSVTATLTYAASIQTGVVRITAVADSMHATADVLQELGATVATSQWAEGEWSAFRGFPQEVAFHEGRLMWFTNIELDGSVSDAFASYDPNTIGDAGPIDRTVATGGLDGIRWALSLQRLVCGTAAQEISIRASALDEPLTPTAFVARPCSSRGAAKVRALRIDQQGIFVGRTADRIYELAWSAASAYIDYIASELTKLNQEICAAGIVDCAAQRQPDTRLWYVLADGSCVVLTYDREEEVIALTPVTTPNGAFERVASLPGKPEDDVYFVVQRTIGGVEKRFVEKLAHRNEAQGGTLNKSGIDAHLVYQGAATATIAGLDYLDGQQVVAWGDGAARITADAPATVTGGEITLPAACANVVVGLPVTGQFESAKLAYGGSRGSGLNRRKRVDHVGLVMADVSWQGVKLGRDFTNLRSLPPQYRGRPLATAEVLDEYDDIVAPFGGGWGTDPRICLQVQGPHCCTLMGLVVAMTTDDAIGDNDNNANDAAAASRNGR